MTDKSKRQRGSRTHGGGTHKNRRGAGHRGGRGDAGRDKHEMHNYPPIGKSGFTRPEKTQDDVATVDVQTLDEDAVLLAADGLAEETDGGYEIDARDVVEDGYEADVVKVLGGGQVRNELTVVADAFSDAAREKIDAAGGSTELSDRGEQRQDKEDADADTE
ncbi:50S ribosomal protein L15P [Halorhabdus tiamatea SARL4B]|uniref:Large ribosomal subunit protein uL15 n=1 Tax=Halorhabdus tiamatea SARL4B TaxID=1033806 RepID=F7PKR4_9EURY|nr:uL15m family ribosomal protein [Halorhabdus tiamatea]ERJ06175.1 50S ribosomal protein L15P [Halorhabdus tiamatea SARL4B]CCQ34048.1 50S ribosomal protein L27Ae (L15p) [Halorhabdus tiamatea SARL4B]